MSETPSEQGDPLPKRAKTRIKPRRNYQQRYDELYFTAFLDGKIRCLICRTTLAEAKESNLQRHFNTHAAIFSCWEIADSSQRTLKYKQLKSVLINECSSSTSGSVDNDSPKSVSTLPGDLVFVDLCL